jgi:hypothetical protein
VKFTVFRVEKRVLAQEQASVDYIDLFEIPDISGFINEDLPGDISRPVVNFTVGQTRSLDVVSNRNAAAVYDGSCGLIEEVAAHLRRTLSRQSD